MKIKAGSGGFTLVESVISIAIGTTFLASVLSAWFFTSKTWAEENVRVKLRYNVLKSMEQLKQDLRLSNGAGILFYPSGNVSNYTAFSLPATNPDANGLLNLGVNGINWSKTIIYHVFTPNGGAGQELRKTVFSSFDSNTVNRQNQLNAVVINGSADSAATTTLFTANTTTLEITSANPTFDGYSASTQLSQKTSFGTLPLVSGSHLIRFEIAGKNTSSSGYGLGVDSISLSPSGGNQEAEALTISADSGKTKVQENIPLWGGNYQLEYQSTVVGDYVTFQTNYDQWLETNFSNVSHSNTSVTGVNPVLTLLSREEQSLTPSWQAVAQTQALLPGVPSNQAVANQSVRSIVSGNVFSRSGQMMRLKFTAGSDAGLVINAAYFGLRNGATANFLAAPIQLYFDNPALPVGSPDPVGAITNPGLNTSITIPAGNYAWSNWFIYSIDTTAPVPDHLISLYVSGSATAWTPDPSGAVESYQVTGNEASSLADWSTLGGYTTGQSTYALTDIATWISQGTATSQIYDTKMTAPGFQQLTWTSVLPAGASAVFKVRSSASATMAGATAWNLVPSLATSPANLGGVVPSNRYIQFQATLQAANPYATYPQADNVKITWPGQNALVEIGGSFTKRPNYGTFRVLVDGQNMLEPLKVKLTARDSFRGKTFENSLSSQVRSRNTGK